MQQVVQEVIAAEAQARSIVERARLERDQLMADARRQAQELAAQATRAALDESRRALAAAHEAAELEKQTRLARSAADIKARIRLEETDLQAAVTGIIQCVSGQRQPIQELPP